MWVPKEQEAAGSRCLRAPRLTRAASALGQRDRRQPAGLWRSAVRSSSLTAPGGVRDADARVGTPGRPLLGRRQLGLERGAGARGRASQSRKGARGAGRAGQVAVLRRRRPARAGRAHLGHETVGAGVLLVLEDDVGVVVGHQIPEALRAPCHPPLGWPTGAQGPFGHAGHKLLVEQRHQLLAHIAAPANRPPARPTALGWQRQKYQAAQGHQTGRQRHGCSGLGPKGNVLVLTSSPVTWAFHRGAQQAELPPECPRAVEDLSTWLPLAVPTCPRGVWNPLLTGHHRREGGSWVSASPAWLCRPVRRCHNARAPP